MTVRFIVDAQLPPALAKMLVEFGHEAEHVIDLNYQAVGDSVIWEYALKHGAVILTKDEDFPHRFHQSVHTPAVVWLRVGNASRKGLLRWFIPLLPKIVNLLEQGNRLIELR
jgi:predicted nuclease of predicted toxin-antitoxin system